MTLWFGENWGNVASVLGLALGIWVLLVSAGTRRATEELRRTFERKSLAQDLRDCGDDLNLINVLNEAERWELVAATCFRIIQKISFLEARWSLHIDDGSRQSLNVAVAQLETIISQVRKFRRIPPKGSELVAVSDSILRINSLFSSEVGKYESRV